MASTSSAGEVSFAPPPLATGSAFHVTAAIWIDTDGNVSNVGIGARFHGPARTPLRVELARSREGTHIVFAASAAF